MMSEKFYTRWVRVFSERDFATTGGIITSKRVIQDIKFFRNSKKIMWFEPLPNKYGVSRFSAIIWDYYDWGKLKRCTMVFEHSYFPVAIIHKQIQKRPRWIYNINIVT